MYMFGDKSIFGSSWNGQNMPKKGQQEEILLCTLNKGQLPTLLLSKSFTFYIPFKNLHVFEGNQGMKHTHLTLFNLKKRKRLLNITEYKIYLIKSFLITY